MALFTSAAVAAFFAVEATFFTAAAAFALNTAVAIGASAVLSVAARAISGNPQNPAGAIDVFGVQGNITTGGDIPRSFGVGKYVTAGSLVYANTYGNVDVVNEDAEIHNKNRWLVQVIALSDLPQGLSRIWVNDQLATLTYNVPPTGNGAHHYYVPEYLKLGPNADDDDTVDPIYGDPFNHLFVSFYDGTQTQVDATLFAQFGDSLDRPYDLTRIAKGIAYVVTIAHVNDKVWTGFPTFKFEMNGISLYDVSKDSSVGGSGSQRWDDPTTWGGDGDELPAVQIYNILRGIRYEGDWVYGLQNMTAYGLPASSWIEQINKCRYEIDGEDGLEPTYRSAGQIDFDSQPANAIEGLLAACQGRLSEIGGRYKLNVGTPASATYFFTDENILSTDDQTYKPFFALSSSINGIQATYPNPEEAWNKATAPAYYRTDIEVIDGNRRLMANPSFDFVPFIEQVQRLQKSAIEEAQRARTHVMVLEPSAYQLEPGDTASWTSERNGYEDKLFRVDIVVDQSDLGVGVSLTEIDPSDYDWDHDTEFTPLQESGEINVYPEPQGMDAFNWVVEPAIVLDDNRISRRPAIRIEWFPGTVDVSGIQYEVRLAADESAVTRGRSDRIIAGFYLITQSLLPNTEYEVRGQFLPTYPKEMAWTDWVSVTTPDVRFSILDVDAAITYQITTLQDSLNDELLRVEQTIATLTSGLASTQWVESQRIRTELNAKSGNLQAFITNVQEVSVSADVALASSITTLSASVDGVAASVVINAAAIATIEGYAAAQYSVTLNVDGYATGFNLLNGGVGTSAFIVVADKFQVQLPSYNGDAPYSVFTTGLVNGVASVGISGSLYLDGTLHARAIVAGTVDATKITAATITTNEISVGGVDLINLIAGAATAQTQMTHGGSTITGTTHTAIGTQVTFTVKGGIAQVVWSTGAINLVNGTGGLLTEIFTIRLITDGAISHDWVWTMAPSVTFISQPISLTWDVAGLSNGSHTFDIEGFTSAGLTSTITYLAGQLTIKDLRR